MSNIFIPDFHSHFSSFIICSFIWLTFLYFLWRRIKAKTNAVQASAFLKALSDCDLVNKLEQIVKDSRSNQTPPDRNSLQLVFRSKIEDAIEADKSALKGIKFDGTNNAVAAVYDHVLNVFLAGSFESRLETEALLKHTELKVFKDSVILKNILSTFVIAGLLGTLVGLGESLRLFDDTSSKMTELVRTQLPEAFIPSIAGVICTILGMFIYSRLVHVYFSPLKTSLENLTLNVWLPKLYPVFTERLIDKLEDNARRIEDQFANAAKVAEFARNIDEETSTFQRNLIHGNELIGRIEPAVNNVDGSVKTLQQFAKELNRFSDSFTKAMDTFKGYEEKLATRYDNLSTSNVNLSDNLSDWVSKFDGIVNHYNSQISIVTDNSKNIFASIMDFEEQYLDSSKEQVEAVTELIRSVKREKESDVVKNREITEKILAESTLKFSQILAEMERVTHSLTTNLLQIDDSLSSRLSSVDASLGNNLTSLTVQVTKSLSEMQTELTGNLKSIPHKLEEHNVKILTQFDRYDAPVKVAADKIEGSYSGMVTGVQALIQQFHNSMESHHTKLEQNFSAKLSEVMIELRNNEERIAAQESVYSRLISSIDTLNKTINEKSERKSSIFPWQ